MKKLNSKGFGTVEVLLIFIIVGIIAGVGWYVWKSKQNTDQSLNNTGNSQNYKPTAAKTTAPITTKPKDETKYLVVKEWGVKFKLPSNLNNMSYEVHSDLVYLGSDQLVALASTCSVADMALGNIQRSTKTSDFNASQNTVKIGQYYFGYNAPQSSCTDSDHAQASELQLAADNQLRDLVVQTLTTTN